MFLTKWGGGTESHCSTNKSSHSVFSLCHRETNSWVESSKNVMGTINISILGLDLKRSEGVEKKKEA